MIASDQIHFSWSFCHIHVNTQFFNPKTATQFSYVPFLLYVQYAYLPQHPWLLNATIKVILLVFIFVLYLWFSVQFINVSFLGVYYI
jgi:hypothetical protein